MASAVASKQATWLRLLLHDLPLGQTKDSPIPILNDNNGYIALFKNGSRRRSRKHIAMLHHFLHEKVEDGAAFGESRVVQATPKVD
jgi:hypothetical protein